MAIVTVCSDFGAQGNKICHCFQTPLFAVKWWDPMSGSLFFECCILSDLIHSTLSPSSRGFWVPLPFMPLRVISCIYLRLLTFLPAIIISTCDSSNPAFHMMYSAYKLNKQCDNIQPWCTPFLILNQPEPVVPCPVLTVASWPAYRFLKRQVRWPGTLISWIFHSLLWSIRSKALT